ncbi:MAG: UDP-glucose 4-epimerase GalE [Bacteroidetes bacterium]|nr:UDP-glucose 4-epimerase GalE [Bacteroidota bacterium]
MNSENPSKSVLVVGGAGYIGSHMVKMLLENKYKVVTLDNLSGGYRDAVVGGEFEQVDLSDKTALEQVFNKYKFDAVMHFASYIQVGESVIKPDMYYVNNLVNTLILLDVMIKHDVNKFIFSSTAALFGEPEYTPIDEKHPTQPINPYGRSKLMVEQILADYDKAYGLKSICLRYFNAAGADPEGLLGERHEPETHLIPLVLQVASRRRESISVFGRDYDTPDGTCVRDYIHIVDLCSAHLLALEKIIISSKSHVYNLGNGNGFSVQEVIDTAEIVTGKEIKVVEAPRREGDPAILLANAALVKTELGWFPQYSKLSSIIEHAWQWELKFYQQLN